MRDIFKISGIIAMAAVIGFSMISCDDLLTKKEKGTGSSPYDWYRSGSSSYTIMDFSQLQELANIVQGKASNGQKSDFSGKMVKLGADIDMSGWTWSGIGNSNTGDPFNGTFDGNGKTIKNLQMSNYQTNNNQGLFGLIGANGTVKNLTLTGLSVSTSDDVGGLTNVNQGTIQTVKVTGNVSGRNTGGFAAMNLGVIKDCTFSGIVTATSGMKAGGIAAYNETGGTIRNCKVPRTINSYYYTNADDSACNNSSNYNTVYDCSFN